MYCDGCGAKALSLTVSIQVPLPSKLCGHGPGVGETVYITNTAVHGKEQASCACHGEVLPSSHLVPRTTLQTLKRLTF